MPFTGKTRAEIRDAILSDWSARMAVLGFALETGVGTDVYDEADTLAADLLPIQGNTETLMREVIPSSASTATLERQAGVVNLPRQEGTPWSGVVTITGTNGTYSVAGRTLVRASRIYRPSASSVTISGGTGTLAVVAAESGTASVLAVGATLQWDAAPTGLPPTAVVSTSSSGTGTAAEADPLLAQRVEGYLRCRPAGGNSQHLIDLAEAHDDVAVAYCYPTLKPNSSGGTAQYNDSDLDTPGAVVLLVAGPAQGQSATNTRNLDAGGGDTVRALVASYFNGLKDSHGATIAGSRLYSAQLDPNDFAVERPAFSGQFIDITVTNSSDFAPSWTGSMTIDAGSDTTHLVVSGDQTTKNGLAAAIQLASGAAARGRVQKRTLGTGVYNGGTGLTTWAVSPALAGTPQGHVDPAPDNWKIVRLGILDRLFEMFDALGPGDVPNASTVAARRSTTRRRRFPPESWQGRASVSAAGIIAAVMKSPGVLDVTVTTPGSAVTPNPKTWLYLDLVRIRFP